MSTDTLPTGPGRPRDEEATAAILAATLRLLAERGYAGTSTADIAAAARASKATVYRRWPSKPALFAQAIQHGLRQAHAAPARTGDVREDIAGVLAAKMAAFAEGPLGGAIRAVISHAAHEPELARAMTEVTQGAREHGPLRGLVEEAKRQGLAPADADTGLLLDLLLGAPFFQLLVLQVPPDPSTARALVRQVFGPADKDARHAAAR
ncbi:TetR/AcrR family transcriptional regulator C-terminal ligand-binding domain-containing protein [Phenylobacterium sp. LjRoot164]|uniref:TetR-like C-terminal domain-containing protein n=1 Tax=unclassified Phenylobacterium TaxID=2640670 RepID=UPI003ECF11A1